MEVLRTILVLIFVVSELGFVLTLQDNKSTISDLNREDNTICTGPKCIMKCCPFGKYVFIRRKKSHKRVRICDYVDNMTRTFSGLVKDVFYSYPEISTLNWTVKSGIFEKNNTFRTETIGVYKFLNLQLTEYPELYLMLPNTYDQLRKPNNMFCWDYYITRSKKNIIPQIWLLFDDHSTFTHSWFNTDYLNHGVESDVIDYAFEGGKLVTCSFLLIVLVVYALLPELRNLSGKILMAHSASLFCAYLLLFVIRDGVFRELTCITLTSLIYYFFLASFCWLNVMSYDIWWTFRGYAKLPSIQRRGKHIKFLKYCLYAFGLPLVMTIALNVINKIDMTHIPWFVKPGIPLGGCFIQDAARFFYMHIPMLILIFCNWIFYLMTAYNLWRLSRGTSVLDSTSASTPYAHRALRHRFMVYLKLSAVMGLHWMLLVVRSSYPGYNAWLISDFYNVLIGVPIFLIFVCKRNIMKKLKKRFDGCKVWPESQKSLSSKQCNQAKLQSEPTLKETP